ncbi:MAG: immunoglobulin-like domain-containing protein [Ferruginibacter sp.]
MKMLKYIIAFLSFWVAMAGCAKEEKIENTDTTVGESKIIFFPTIVTKGSKLVIIDQGTTYTDLGAEAILGGATTTYTTSGGPINTAAPGVYNLKYLAANPEGYTAEDFRTVVVIGNDVAANNFSGTYRRAATGVNSTWTKTAKGVYTVENPGGAGAGTGLTVIAVNYTGNKIAIPKHVSPDFGVVSSGTETYNAGASPITYSWIFFAGGYGTGLRTFTKQ